MTRATLVLLTPLLVSVLIASSCSSPTTAKPPRAKRFPAAGIGTRGTGGSSKACRSPSAGTSSPPAAAIDLSRSTRSSSIGRQVRPC